MVALLAPEFVVFNAWSQRRQAVRFARMLWRRSGQEELGSRTVTLWRYLWPRTRVFDQEKRQHQEKQQDAHVSESRVQIVDQERRQSPHTQQDVLALELQEQGEAHEYDGTESVKGSVQVRLRESFYR